MATNLSEALYRLLVAVRDHEIQGNPYGNDVYELASRALLEAVGWESSNDSAWMDAPAIYNKVTNAPLNSLRDWRFAHELLFKNAGWPEQYLVYRGFLIVFQNMHGDQKRTHDYRVVIFEHRGSTAAVALADAFVNHRKYGLLWAYEQIDQYLTQPTEAEEEYDA